MSPFPRVRCVEKNLRTHPAFLKGEEYELIEDFIWRGTRYYRVRLHNGTEVDADPYDFSEVFSGDAEADRNC